MEIIRSENLDKIYKDNWVPVQALKNINLTVKKGDYMVIAGPSGSGKTTLLNLLGALDKPTSGKIFFEGADISKKTVKELSGLRLNKLGFIFQAYNLIPVLSAIENIEFSLMLLGKPEALRRKLSLNALRDLGIEELANKRPNEMSGGQQQRVAVARAIVNDPSVVLADEPTANLDTATGSNLLDLMDEMNRSKNITFLFSSHDPQVIERARILIRLRDGQIESVQTK
ncbi:MAG: ABC transporter ATP-binding protein [Ignavibacteriales bacterium]|nr:ABC transporter ATP-binding protein [Ignavibacteriales bacterium]MCF8305826.1 ABC transporter ATP-binding protein [Ignavibacteriales bacterium]MCF8315548.1 ABC transporter ATP-binding protein [Ignavibacteriales bacterium]MCF8436922.1 ABC transporter ATP-binding protein [Ignavibacteriales bacterium]